MNFTKIGLACASVVAFGTGSAGLSDVSPFAPQPLFIEHEFKLKGGGQVDLDAGTMSLAGQASHIGRLTFEGTLVPGTGRFHGTMFGQNGEGYNADFTLDQPVPGVYALTMTFSTQSTHSDFVRGVGTGPVHMDQDNMFTVEIDGTLFKCGGVRCLD